LVIAIPVMMIGLVFLALAIPQYAKYRRGKMDNSVLSAFFAVATSEEAYFAQNGRYTDSYQELTSEGGLLFFEKVCYGPLELYRGSSSDSQGTIDAFKFKIRHAVRSEIGYSYDSAASTTVEPISDIEPLLRPRGRPLLHP
jgi:hypothetical protein